MRKRILLLIITMLLTAVITYGEYQYMKGQIEEEPLETIYCFSRSLEKGEQVKAEDFDEKAIKESDLEAYYVRDITSILGMYTAVSVLEGNIVVKEQLTLLDQLTFGVNEDHILVTFAFDGETSNGWNLRKGQQVQLLYCPREDGSYELFDKVLVHNIFSKEVLPMTEGAGNELKYVTFEIKKEDGYELVSKRDKGRVEIIIL